MAIKISNNKKPCAVKYKMCRRLIQKKSSGCSHAKYYLWLPKEDVTQKVLEPLFSINDMLLQKDNSCTPVQCCPGKVNELHWLFILNSVCTFSIEHLTPKCSFEQLKTESNKVQTQLEENGHQDFIQRFLD